MPTPGCVTSEILCGGGETYKTEGWQSPNILLIMVDQMGVNRWVPGPTEAGGITAIQDMLPHITALQSQSFVFSNYFVAATACTPSRATFLTGLYSQQSCVFVTADQPNARLDPSGVYPPSLLPYNSGAGFPSIGDVLSQSLVGYNTVWIGKWHLGDGPLESGSPYNCNPGGNGPSDYGFSDQYEACIPTPPGGSSFYPWPYASPNGYTPNAGNSADFLGTATVPSIGDVPNYAETVEYPDQVSPSFDQLNDSAVATAFQDWLNRADGSVGDDPVTLPWFTAVSFLNPHDISQYPYSFNLISSAPTNAYYTGFQPPPPTTAPATYSSSDVAGEQTTIAAYNSSLFASSPGVSDLYYGTGYDAPWNNSDNVSATAYSAGGKPDIQAFYKTNSINQYGNPTAVTNGWYTFLNYYYWLQACVDIQVGNVLGWSGGSSYASNTLVIFTSDHGDFAGSHQIRGKVGAVYDEATNVPLYISFPTQRSNGQTHPIYRSFVCSSVDILPFLYSMALGNESWRCDASDIIGYLNGRESIMDAILAGSAAAEQRRISNIPLANSYGENCWQQYQPYVITTTDEFWSVTTHPPHAVGFRTVDNTVSGAFSDTGPFGGGKLGIYSHWYGCDPPDGAQPTYANDGAGQQQFEYYNYSADSPGGDSLAPNLGETGNQYFNPHPTVSASAALYVDTFGTMPSTSGNELTEIPSALATAYDTALALWVAYSLGYQCTGGCSGD